MKRFTKNNWFLEKNPTIVTFPLKNFDLRQFIPIDGKESAKYDLIANICHEGEPNKGSYKIHVYHKVKCFLLVKLLGKRHLVGNPRPFSYCDHSSVDSFIRVLCPSVRKKTIICWVYKGTADVIRLKIHIQKQYWSYICYYNESHLFIIFCSRVRTHKYNSSHTNCINASKILDSKLY